MFYFKIINQSLSLINFTHRWVYASHHQLIVPRPPSGGWLHGNFLVLLVHRSFPLAHRYPALTDTCISLDSRSGVGTLYLVRCGFLTSAFYSNRTHLTNVTSSSPADTSIHHMFGHHHRNGTSHTGTCERRHPLLSFSHVFTWKDTTTWSTWSHGSLLTICRYLIGSYFWLCIIIIIIVFIHTYELSRRYR